MIEKLLNYLENKRILILGFGKEGESTYKLLRKYFPEKNLFIADKNMNLLIEKIDLMEDPYLEVSLGENYLNGIEEYDLIIKAPGISFKGIDISSFENKITSQLELFLENISCHTVGITGTKGKSTTSTLMYEVLKANDKKTFLLGNIGKPIFDEIENIDEDTFVVIELSSHALQYIKQSVDIAILLNIHEEHLDHYNDYLEYVLAKMNIGIYQKEGSHFIINSDDSEILKSMESLKEKFVNKIIKKVSLKNNNYDIDTYINENNCICIKDKDNISKNVFEIINVEELLNAMCLKGMHNVNNIMFILTASEILNLSLDKTINAIKSFKPLEHRMEFVARINDVDYYNDSIATIPSSTINAIEAIKNIGTLIVGGKDRGINLEELYDYLENTDIENIICLPKTGEYIAENLRNRNVDKNIVVVDNLEDAVKIAKKVTSKNKNCIMSPAASSYGYFKNFEERGKLFKKYVLENNN